MTYGVAIQIPEVPITETWSWLTDIGVSYNGNEDRTALLRYPRRSFSGNFAFDDVTSLRRHLAMMTARYKTEFQFPLWQYQTKLKAAAGIGDTTVTVNARRGDFREGQTVIVIEGTNYETIVVDSFDAVSVTFATALTKAYSARAVVCPVVTVFTATNAGVSRRNPDGSGTSSFNYVERLPTLPFVSPLNEASIATFDGLPLLPYVPMGQSFEATVATGLTSVEYTGIVDIVSPWTYEQWGYALSFKASAIGNVDDFEWWQLFAETIQGSENPFLMPTNRADMEIVTPATPSGTGITVKGDEYSQHYYGHGGFSRIFIDTDAGRHYAKVTGIVAVAGNDRLVFTPALPAGAAWGTGQRVGFLLKLRNNDDRMTLQHSGLSTVVGLSVRTVV